MVHEQITVIAYLHVEPGTEQGFLERVPAIVAQTREEPGCLNYDFHQHESDPHRFVFYENYVDRAAFDAHLAQDYIRAWIAYAERHGAYFDVDFWTMVSSPQEERRAGG